MPKRKNTAGADDMITICVPEKMQISRKSSRKCTFFRLFGHLAPANRTEFNTVLLLSQLLKLVLLLLQLLLLRLLLLGPV